MTASLQRRRYPARPRGARIPAVLAAGLALSCQPAPTGIRVSIDTGGFTGSVTTLRLTINVDGGFKGMSAPSRDGLRSTYTASGLQMDFSPTAQHPFTGRLAFRLETDNRKPLTFNARAFGFNALNNKIASSPMATGVTLPAGGEAPLDLALQEDTDGTTIDDTMIDLANAIVDRKVGSPAADAAPATVAVCNLDGNGGALVIGVPSASANGANPNTGAVYVVFDGTTDVNLAASTASQEMHFYGVNGGDQLGAAIACLDLNDDNVDDLIVGAPGAFGNAGLAGAGRVYVIKGRSNLRSSSFDLGQHQVEIEWVGGAANAALGTRVVATGMQKDHLAVLIGAPGEGGGMVHLVNVNNFATAVAPAAPQVLSGTAGHVTFSGVNAQAIAVGDLDGNGTDDGGADVMLGDPAYREPQAPNRTLGAVYFFRNVAPASTTAFSIGGTGASGPARMLTGNADRQAFGTALLAIEVTGPYPDLIVGAPGDNDKQGAVMVHEHQSNFLDGTFSPGYFTPKWTFNGAVTGERFGATLASGRAGGDAGAGLFVGAPDALSGSKTAAGAVRGYRRFTDGNRPTLSQGFFGAVMNARLGSAIAVGSIGRANNVADLVMLAPGLGDGTSPTGTAYVHLTRTSP